MTPLYAGTELIDARNTLKMSQRQLADALGIAPATLRRYEISAELELMVALAVECLLRRQARSAALTPEEKAERRFREQQKLAELKAAAGLGARPRRTPTEQAQARLERTAEYLRLKADSGIVAASVRVNLAASDERRRLKYVRKRNRAREAERPLIAQAHAELAHLPLGSNERSIYVSGARTAAVDVEQYFLANYLNSADVGVVADDDPLVTLPMEDE